MNVRITPRGLPNRTDLYGGVARINSDGRTLWLVGLPMPWTPLSTDSRRGVVGCVEATCLRLADVAEIALDDEPGDWW